MKEIEKNEDYQNLIQSPLSLVYITAVWCGPCKAFSPLVSEIAEVYQDKLSFAKLDADKMSEQINLLNVRSIPTVIIFKNGQEIQRFSGVKSKLELINSIESNLTHNFSSDEDF